MHDMTPLEIDSLSRNISDCNNGFAMWSLESREQRDGYIQRVRPITAALMARDLQLLTDNELHKLIAKTTVRDAMCVSWGWGDNNPDGTARVGCLIGSIYAVGEFFDHSRTSFSSSTLEAVLPDKARLYTLAAYIFPAWAGAGRCDTIAIHDGHRIILDQLSAEALDELAHLLENEYNRRFPVTLRREEADELEQIPIHA